MNRIYGLLICLTVILAVFCAVLAVRLNAEKSRSDELVVRTHNLAIEIEKLGRESSRHDYDGSEKTDSTPPVAIEKRPSVSTPLTPKLQETDVVQAREAAFARQRLLIRRDYALLLRRLAMPAQQEDDLAALLQSFNTPRTEVRDPSISRSDIRRQQRAERTEKVAMIIGYDRLPLYEDYMSKLAEYSQVSQIGMHLEASGHPISNEQKEAIVSAMVSERERVPDPSEAHPIRTQDDLDRQFAWMEDYDRRVSEDVSTMLSSKQLEYLNEFLAARSASRHVALRSAIQPRLITN